MASTLSNASTNSNGSTISASAAMTVTVTGSLAYPAVVYIEYLQGSEWVKSGLKFHTPGVADIDLNSGAGSVRAVLAGVDAYTSKSTSVSVDIS